MVPRIKLVHQEKRVIEVKVTGNLNGANTKMIMDIIIPHVKTSTKIICSYKSEIHRGAGEIMDYSRMLNSPLGMFASLEEIQEYIE